MHAIDWNTASGRVCTVLVCNWLSKLSSPCTDYFLCFVTCHLVRILFCVTWICQLIGTENSEQQLENGFRHHGNSGLAWSYHQMQLMYTAIKFYYMFWRELSVRAWYQHYLLPAMHCIVLISDISCQGTYIAFKGNKQTRPELWLPKTERTLWEVRWWKSTLSDMFRSSFKSGHCQVYSYPIIPIMLKNSFGRKTNSANGIS